MASIAVTKMSSKGQVVIPAEMRVGIKEGEQMVIIKAGNQIIMEKVSKFSKKLKEDLIFAKRTEEAWKRYDRGEFTTSSVEDFLKEMKTW